MLGWKRRLEQETRTCLDKGGKNLDGLENNWKEDWNILGQSNRIYLDMGLEYTWKGDGNILYGVEFTWKGDLNILGWVANTLEQMCKILGEGTRMSLDRCVRYLDWGLEYNAASCPLSVVKRGSVLELT